MGLGLPISVSLSLALSLMDVCQRCLGNAEHIHRSN